MPYVKTWLASMQKNFVHPETPEYVLDLFARYVDQGLKFVQKKCTQMINQVSIIAAPARVAVVGVVVTCSV